MGKQRHINLTQDERTELEQLIRSGINSARIIGRARTLLLLDRSQGQARTIAEVVEATPFSPDMEYVELLKFAMHKERNSFRMYWFMAENTDDKEMAAVFSKLATEEAYHKLRLEIEYDLAVF